MRKTTKVVLAGVMTFALVSVVSLVLLTNGAVRTVLASGPQLADFALLDQETGVGDKGVACGAVGTAFEAHITMTNRSDISGADGFVRVKYHDNDFVDYAIPVNTTVQISLVGGGTPGTDDGFQVTNGGSGARLVGQASILLHTSGAKLSAISSTSFCTTTVSTGTLPFGA